MSEDAKKPVPVRLGIGGPHVGKVTNITEDDRGLIVTAALDTDVAHYEELMAMVGEKFSFTVETPLTDSAISPVNWKG